MRRLPLLVAFVALLVLSSAGRQDVLVKASHPSLVSELLVTHAPAVPDEHTPEALAASARAFLAGLEPGRRTEAALPLDSEERARWTNTPPGTDEGGVRLGDCTAQELHGALDLLRAVLSEAGYAQVRDTLLADDRLLRNGQPRRGFGAENFWLAIFGEPSAAGPWGLQLDGHHLALNMTFAGSQVSLSPTFLGAQPAAFERAGARYEPLSGPVHSAFELVNALDETQRTRAVIADRRGRIQTAAGRDGVVPDPVGLPCAELNAEQHELLVQLVGTYVQILPEPFAAARLTALEAELAQMHFAWSGPLSAGSDVSYIVQGPTLILEYACQDLGGNPLDHLHAMYRDPQNEYGAQWAK